MALKTSKLVAAEEFIKFVNKAPSPFHAVDECIKLLTAKGFKEIKECESWDIKPLDKYFLTRNRSSLIAFAIGKTFQPGNGFSIIGAHTDSPCLKIKPVSNKVKNGYIQVGVECYGGGSWHTWFDRDLTVAGKVIVKESENKIVQKLVNVKKPILRVPNVAIHLNRDMGTKFEWNKETNLLPVLATTVEEILQRGSRSLSSDTGNKHSPIILELLCNELKINSNQILDFELCLADTQPATIGGIYDEFIFSPRLDNLHSSYCAIMGLINSLDNDTIMNDGVIRMASLFDNEEVGSQSAQGAGSTLQELVMRRLCKGSNTVAFEESIPKSMMLSCDMAHAVHPNYADKHEENHRPVLHKGIVVKTNQNQRYATTSITSSILREIAKIKEVPLQEFVVRNDSACGSTIGPIMSAKLGIATIDLGAPQLSMHSIREMCDVSSVSQLENLCQSFYENYFKIFSKFE